MVKKVKYKIAVPENYDLDKLKKEVSLGGKFVIYSYCISLILGMLPFVSKAYFINHKEKATKYNTKYNLILYLFGWWEIPWGITNTINRLRMNNKGGIDVTKDIMLNITEESLIEQKVEISELYTIFSHPKKSEIKSMKKMIEKNYHLIFFPIVKTMYFACFTNVEEYQSPVNVIGIIPKNNFEKDVEHVRKYVYKVFYKRVYFEFVDLRETNEFNKKLMEQGVKLL